MYSEEIDILTKLSPQVILVKEGEFIEKFKAKYKNYKVEDLACTCEHCKANENISWWRKVHIHDGLTETLYDDLFHYSHISKYFKTYSDAQKHIDGLEIPEWAKDFIYIVNLKDEGIVPNEYDDGEEPYFLRVVRYEELSSVLFTKLMKGLYDTYGEYIYIVGSSYGIEHHKDIITWLEDYY